MYVSDRKTVYVSEQANVCNRMRSMHSIRMYALYVSDRKPLYVSDQANVCF